MVVTGVGRGIALDRDGNYGKIKRAFDALVHGTGSDSQSGLRNGSRVWNLNFLHELITPAHTKIVMLVMDGLGGLPLEPGGKTELETAHTPNLDALAGFSALGLSVPVGPGITVESGPGHLALFGYDPLQYRIGRGVLEAVGIGIDLEPDDIAVRGNYCTVDVKPGW